jgi:hypothetical protein
MRREGTPQSRYLRLAGDTQICAVITIPHEDHLTEACPRTHGVSAAGAPIVINVVMASQPRGPLPGRPGVARADGAARVGLEPQPKLR